MFNFIRKNRPTAFLFFILSVVILGLALWLEYGFGVRIDETFSFVHWIVLAGTVGLGITVVIMFYNVMQILRALQRYEEGGKDHPFLDITDKAPSPPDECAEHIAEIEALGLTPFAVLDASEAHDGSNILWYWADESKTVRAYMTTAGFARQVLMAFITVLEDDAVIETTYRVRMQLDTETMHIRNVTSSIAAAYDFHQHQIVAYEGQHGQPVAIPTPADLVDVSNRLKKRHSGEVMRNRLEVFRRFVIVYGGLVAALTIALILSPRIHLIYSFVAIMAGYALVQTFTGFREAEAAIGSVDERKKKKN